MIELKNNHIQVLINQQGATLDKVFSIDKNTDLLWDCSHEKSWDKKDATIFPFIGRMVDKYYLVNNKKYSMDTHGFLDDKLFNIDYCNDNEVSLSYSSNEETLKDYPFEFKFSKIFKISDNKVTVSFKIENKNDIQMPFAFGGHPAIKLCGIEKETISDTSCNYLVFDKTIHAKNYLLNKDGAFIESDEDFTPTNMLELKKDLFKKYPTLMLHNEKFEYVIVKRADGINVKVTLNNPPILAFWTFDDFGSYVCVEPWFGMPDEVPPIRELKEKKNIELLDKNSIFNYCYSIECL